MDFLRLFVAFARTCLIPRACLAAENLDLRQQLIVQRRSVRRPKLRNRDRRGDSPVDQADVPGEPVSGCPAYLVGAPVTGLFGRGADGRQVHDARREAALTDVEDLSR